MFFEVIDQSAPHIYHSALPFSPPTSHVHTLYKQYAHPFARAIQGLPTSQEAGVVTKHSALEGPVEVIWSPCNRFLVVMEDAQMGDSLFVDILDATTLNQFDGLHSNHIESGKPVLSPDGHSLTLLSHECIIVCDLQTGGPTTTIPLELDLPVESSSPPIYSTDGKEVAFAYKSEGREDTLIISYNLLSGIHTHPQAFEGCIIGSIWTHDESIQFATVRHGLITIWEVTFTLTHAPAEVESLPAPDEIVDGKNFLFLPALFRLAFTLQKKILVWDAKASKFLLKSRFIEVMDDTNQYNCTGSFSLDGQFFAHPTDSGKALIWKESPTGYILHQKVTFASVDIHSELHLSPDGESVVLITADSLHLWPTSDQTVSYPRAQGDVLSGYFILEISPNETFAAFALADGAVTVIDLHSGNSLLVIDLNEIITCLGITETTITVVCQTDMTAWNIPMGNSAPGATVGIEQSIWTVELGLQFSTNHPSEMFARLFSERCLEGTKVTREGLELRFSPDGHQVWIKWGSGFNAKGWKIIEDDELITTKLEPLVSTTPPPGTFSQKPSYSFGITYDGWVLNSAQKRLLWLPHHWRADENHRAWSGQFFGASHEKLPRAVILEFFV